MQSVRDFYELQKKQRARFRRKFCLSPEAPEGCSKNFVAAHTVQRALIERHLAENRHVLRFTMDVNPKLNAVLFAPDLIGINNATTFFGFCGKHDDQLFKPLEMGEFEFREDQVGLLGFRAISRELYCKEAELDVNTMLKDHMMKRSDLQTLERAQYLIAKNFALKNARRNLKRAWQQFGHIITPEGISRLRYYAVQFDQRPVVFASSAFLPEWDFEGNQLQDLTTLDDFHGIAFSSWAAGQDSIFTFCWHQDWDPICRPFIESLRRIDDARLSNRLLAMVFETSENVIMRPSWWENLNESDKDLLTQRVPSGLLSQDRRHECLLDDGLNALSGNVKGIFTNL